MGLLGLRFCWGACSNCSHVLLIIYLPDVLEWEVEGLCPRVPWWGARSLELEMGRSALARCSLLPRTSGGRMVKRHLGPSLQSGGSTDRSSRSWTFWPWEEPRDPANQPLLIQDLLHLTAGTSRTQPEAPKQDFLPAWSNQTPIAGEMFLRCSEEEVRGKRV